MRKARGEGAVTQVEALQNSDPLAAKRVLEASKTVLPPDSYDTLVNRLRPMIAGTAGEEAIRRAAAGQPLPQGGGDVQHQPPAAGSPTLSDRDALAAETRIRTGAGSAADHALLATYHAQQNAPVGAPGQPASQPAAAGALPQDVPLPPERGDGGPTPSTSAGTVQPPSPIAGPPVTSPRHADFRLRPAAARRRSRGPDPRLQADAVRCRQGGRRRRREATRPLQGQPRHPAHHRDRSHEGRRRSAPGAARHVVRAGAAPRHPHAAGASPGRPRRRRRARAPSARAGWGGPRRSSPRPARPTGSRETTSRGRSRSRAAPAPGWVVVSPTGAAGPFQFTRDTARPHGTGRPQRPRRLGRRRRAAGGTEQGRSHALARPRNRPMPSSTSPTSRAAPAHRRCWRTPTWRRPTRWRPPTTATAPQRRTPSRSTAGDPNAPAAAFTAKWGGQVQRTRPPVAMFASGFGSGQPYFGGAPAPGVEPPLPSSAPLPDPSLPAALAPSLMEQAQTAPSAAPTLAAPPAPPAMGQTRQRPRRPRHPHRPQPTSTTRLRACPTGRWPWRRPAPWRAATRSRRGSTSPR